MLNQARDATSTPRRYNRVFLLDFVLEQPTGNGHGLYIERFTIRAQCGNNCAHRRELAKKRQREFGVPSGVTFAGKSGPASPVQLRRE